MNNILKEITDRMPDFIINYNIQGFTISVEDIAVEIEIRFSEKKNNYYYSYILGYEEYSKIHSKEMLIDSVFNCMEYQVKKLRESGK